jgi:hypothetical protein
MFNKTQLLQNWSISFKFQLFKGTVPNIFPNDAGLMYTGMEFYFTEINPENWHSL